MVPLLDQYHCSDKLIFEVYDPLSCRQNEKKLIFLFPLCCKRWAKGTKIESDKKNVKLHFSPGFFMDHFCFHQKIYLINNMQEKLVLKFQPIQIDWLLCVQLPNFLNFILRSETSLNGLGIYSMHLYINTKDK